MFDATEFFSPGGPLAQAHPNYEYRPGQDRMSAAVAATLRNGGALMVEAGTGTGKTLAYLVPALASGKRVILSTGTRNLQDQIYTKDLPFLEGMGLQTRACMMKGRENYLCRQRFGQMQREPLLEDLGELPWIDKIATWSKESVAGDRAELADLPDRLRLWRDINARADTCGGSQCPEYEECWLTRVKRRAADSQLIVVNHHLFFADLALRSAFGSVLPDYDCVIFDEAHLLEEVATLYFGLQATSGQFADLADDAERLAAASGGNSRGGGGSAGLRAAAENFFEPIRRRLLRESGRVRFEPATRGGLELEAEWATLCEALDEIVRCSGAVGIPADKGESLARRAEDLREALTRILDRDDAGYVYGMERRGRGALILSAAPIDVSGLLRERLFDRLQSAVLTSATMTVEGRFDFFVNRLGLESAETLRVESGFDHRSQAMLYLPRRMPLPSEAGFREAALDRIVELLEISRGRAFLLFTSYAQMEWIHEQLVRLDRWPMLLQGEGSKVALVDRFRQSRGAVLCGTTSFWHGVDVAGEALSLVVIDKLPFGVPSDPLVEARIDRIRRAGGNPFAEYQVPLAVLELNQGLGRLLRSRSDRGLLAVLDPRLTSKSYGATFLRSLPSFSLAHEIEACRAFMAQAVEG